MLPEYKVIISDRCGKSFQLQINQVITEEEIHLLTRVSIVPAGSLHTFSVHKNHPVKTFVLSLLHMTLH